MGHYEYEVVRRYVPDKYNNRSCGCGCSGCGCLFWIVVLIVALQFVGCIDIKPLGDQINRIVEKAEN